MKISVSLGVFLISTVATLSALTKTTTTVSSSLNPSKYGQSVTFTAVVTSSLGAPPNGEIVTFKQGNTVLGTQGLSGGSASLTVSTLSAGGTDLIKAVYAGDSTFATSTSATLSQVVNAATTTTTLVCSQNPSNVGQSVTFTASVAPQFSGSVTGSVAFYNGSSKMKTVTLAGGVASYTSTTLPQGTDSMTAVYNGSTSFSSSTSPAMNQSVEAGTYINSTMTWDGITRYYEVYLPAVLPANPPMLLMLHGTTRGATVPTTLNWGWSSIAEANSFILVQPASTYNTTTEQWNWNAYFMDAAFAAPAPDDSGFLRQLILNLTAQYNVNPNMVYVTGFSSGAQMTQRVGVEISDLVAAIVPASGQLVGQQVPPPGLPGGALSPVSVQEWHGTSDSELPPCDYGTTEYSNVTFTLDTVDDSFNYWVGQNSCSTLQTTETLCTNGEANPNLTGNVATGCTETNVEVQFIWEEGDPHNYESGNNASRWSFMAAHPKASSGRKSVAIGPARNLVPVDLTISRPILGKIE